MPHARRHGGRDEAEVLRQPVRRLGGGDHEQRGHAVQRAARLRRCRRSCATATSAPGRLRGAGRVAGQHPLRHPRLGQPAGHLATHPAGHPGHPDQVGHAPQHASPDAAACHVAQESRTR